MKYFTEDEIREQFKLTLPKGYLSYSQIDKWQRSPESYRKEYYGGKKFDGNMYTEFGNAVTLAMANQEDWVSFLPRFSVFEWEFIINCDGIPLKGSIDQFEPGPNAFVEQKTVKNKWSDNKIQKHKQFDYYSLAIDMLEGFVQDEAYFLDVRTDMIEKKEIFNGIELSGGAPELTLTGEWNLIPRIVTHDDRKAAYEEIVAVGRAIEEDFKSCGHLYR